MCMYVRARVRVRVRVCVHACACVCIVCVFVCVGMWKDVWVCGKAMKDTVHTHFLIGNRSAIDLTLESFFESVNEHCRRKVTTPQNDA